MGIEFHQIMAFCGRLEDPVIEMDSTHHIKHYFLLHRCSCKTHDFIVFLFKNYTENEVGLRQPVKFGRSLQKSHIFLVLSTSNANMLNMPCTP